MTDLFRCPNYKWSTDNFEVESDYGIVVRCMSKIELNQIFLMSLISKPE